MRFEVMEIKDIDLIVPLYIEYYNNHEESCWTQETAKRRIRQVLAMNDSYSLMMRDNDGEVCGFVMGYYKQYDDIVGYTLEEILIAHKHQNKGYGSAGSKGKRSWSVLCGVAGSKG